jgi:hypothetical protein
VNIDEANARLPLVRAVVKDVMERWKELKTLRARIAKLTREGADEVAIERAGARAEELEAAIRGYSRELEDIGVQLKDHDMGLVDFPAKVGARTVLLCWKAGEDRVEWWHEASTGFAGRKPISELK